MNNKASLALKRHFEDFKVGERFTTTLVEVTREMIKRFAREYDPQPIHLDEEAAKKSMFGELIGSGWHTGALSMRLVAEIKPFGEAPVVGVEVHSMKFLRPLKPGMQIRVKGKIIEAWRSRTKPLGFFKVELLTETEDDQPLLTQTWTVVVPTRNS